MVRKSYTKEFKLEVVQASYSTDKSQAQFADDMGIGRSTLTNWRAAFKTSGDGAFPGSGNQTPDDSEVSGLKRDLRRARQERDILKKALAFFAQANP